MENWTCWLGIRTCYVLAEFCKALAIKSTYPPRLHHSVVWRGPNIFKEHVTFLQHQVSLNEMLQSRIPYSSGSNRLWPYTGSVSLLKHASLPSTTITIILFSNWATDTCYINFKTEFFCHFRTSTLFIQLTF